MVNRGCKKVTGRRDEAYIPKKKKFEAPESVLMSVRDERFAKEGGGLSLSPLILSLVLF